MSTHSQRLKNDLVKLQLLAEESRGADPDFDIDIATIISRCTNNLFRCERSELKYCTAEQINSGIVAPIIEGLVKTTGRDDVPDCKFYPPYSLAGEQQLAALADLRMQLENALSADEPSIRQIRKLTSAIIKSEIQLQSTLMQDGVYLNKDACNAFADGMGETISAWSRTNIPQDEWELVVDKVIGTDG